MKRQVRWFCFFLLLSIPLGGCAAPAVLVGGAAAMTAASGTYIYLGGELKTDYNAPFDRVWAACEKTVAQMRGVNVQPSREIGQGSISAAINDEKVNISVKYKTKNLTTVSVRVGTLGNKLSSQVLHDKIGDNIQKN